LRFSIADFEGIEIEKRKPKIENEKMIDTSVFCGHWPFRYLPDAGPHGLKSRLLSQGITEAWVAPLDAVFYQDPMHANELLHAAIQDDEYFVPVGALDVSLPSWRHDARRCLEKLRCRAFKIFPNYHRFAASGPEAVALCELAREANVPVCIQMRMQDEREHHPLVKVPGVPWQDVLDLARKAPRTRLLVCAPYRNELKELQAAANIWAEFSFVEWELSLRTAIAAFRHERLVFGSHAPLYYVEAEEAKLDVVPADFAGENSLAVVAAIREGNARKLLEG